MFIPCELHNIQHTPLFLPCDVILKMNNFYQCANVIILHNKCEQGN